MKKNRGKIELNRQWINRIIIYLLGLLILAFGISMNTKAGLGVSAIISVSYSISLVMGFNFGNTTLGLYTFFVLILIYFILSEYIVIREKKTMQLLTSGAKISNLFFLWIFFRSLSVLCLPAF